ncbi:MAG: XdhC family protein [Hydrogenobacter sp.]|uniref:XdhC family protein n=1 Tax=Hydrogenobacter thermophilus TaxID=940 RepID=UPI0030FB7BD8
MQTWKEAKLLAEGILDCKKRGVRCALLTIVSVRGSSYRKEGAKFLVTEEGEEICSISGGCLERGLLDTALEVIMRNSPMLERINMEEESSWGMWLGCPGEVDIYIEPLHFDQVLSAWVDAVVKGEKFVLAKRLFSEDKLLVTEKETVGNLTQAKEEALSLLHTYGIRPYLNGDIFFDTLLRYPPIHIFGSGEEAHHMRELANILGFEVYLHEPSERVKIEEGSFVLVANHNIKADRVSLKQALMSKASYIGVVSSRKRFLKLSEDLQVDDRIYCPAGLDLGSFTPEEVAFSIMAEILKIYWGKTGESLKKVKQEVTYGTGS